MNYRNFKTILTALLMTSLASNAAMAQEQAAPSASPIATDMMNLHVRMEQAAPSATAIATAAMTLRDCMEYAVSNSTKMRISEADRNDEQALRRQAIMQAFSPRIEAQSYAYNQFGRNLDPETNTYNTVTTFYNGYSLNGGFTLFDGFKAVNNVRIANTSAKMGLSKEKQTRDEICLATMEAFYNVLYYTELEQVLIDQVETAETALTKATREEEFGTKGHADVVQMASELAKKRYNLTNTTNLKNDALITLKDVMFWPIEEELVLDTTLPELRACADGKDGIVNTAMAFLPKAQIATFNLQNAKSELSSARWSYSPNLGLYAGWSTTYYTYPGKSDYTPTPFSEQFKGNGGEYVQLQLSIPIFDKFSRRTKIAQKKNAYSRASAEYDQAMRDIENEVARAINDCNGAEAAFYQAESLAEVEEEAYRLNSRRFDQGLISSIEYQTASEAYLNAQAEKLYAHFKYRIKNSVVLYLNGITYLEQ